MPVAIGKTEKLHIVAFKNADFSLSSIAGPPFFVLINPESYTCRYKIDYCDTQESGSSGTSLKFNKIPPQEFSFDFLFDGTDVIPSVFQSGLPVIAQLEVFKRSIMDYSGVIHRPHYLVIHWGTLLFKGVLVSMDIEFKLFSPSGIPVRAIAKCTFRESVPDQLRHAKENRMSPDISHQRMIKESDKLPLVTKEIYQDQQYYIDVAGYNKMDSFRKIKPGTAIAFPPVEH
ncbi:MAG: LysM peptidoglycan-binding domain-containing protein [Chitinophagaceae bacterium]|nr:LysM peptidoglycan-binding domain-containing protein [Chitinophagaceae bacterium]